MTIGVRGIVNRLRDLASDAGKKVEKAVPAPAKAAAQNLVRLQADVFETARRAAGTALGRIQTAAERGLERPFAIGRDGFVAFDASGRVIGGRPPGARVADMDVPASRLDSVVRLFANSDDVRLVKFELPDGTAVAGRTEGQGARDLPLEALPLAGLDPKRGGLLELKVATPDGPGDQARVLALPRDYDGPIFVSDIDDTLRATSYGAILAGETQPPIAGAAELLQSVARQGVPIVYLSAGANTIRRNNLAFLAQLPPGVLLDRPRGLLLSDLNPSNAAQASGQGAYKAGVLAELKRTYPNARLFGLGDDKYGDAIAYSREGLTAYIHDVRAGDANIPAGFSGRVTRDYSPDFIAQVASDLQAAIAGSDSFR